ncbi:MAG: universal stress protein [Rhodospirillaceae bacterium]
MKPNHSAPLAAPRTMASADDDRIFLLVLDGSDEQRAAIRYAAQRAKATGGQVALMLVTQPVEFEHWMFVGNLMREEAREAAEHAMNRYASVVRSITGHMPIFYLREGDPVDELFKLLREEDFSVLILAAGEGQDGPGPIVQAVTGKQMAKLTLPITIVPGTLSDEEIDAVT